MDITLGRRDGKSADMSVLTANCAYEAGSKESSCARTAQSRYKIVTRLRVRANANSNSVWTFEHVMGCKQRLKLTHIDSLEFNFRPHNARRTVG